MILSSYIRETPNSAIVLFLQFQGDRGKLMERCVQSPLSFLNVFPFLWVNLLPNSCHHQPALAHLSYEKGQRGWWGAGLNCGGPALIVLCVEPEFSEKQRLIAPLHPLDPTTTKTQITGAGKISSRRQAPLFDMYSCWPKVALWSTIGLSRTLHIGWQIENGRENGRSGKRRRKNCWSRLGF